MIIRIALDVTVVQWPVHLAHQVITQEGKMIKCDGCAERVKHGLEPACVNNCATGALRLLEEVDLEDIGAERSLYKKMKGLK